MRNYPRFLKAFAYLLSFTTSIMPLHGYAANQPNVDAQDFISQLGREGQAFAKEIGSEMSATPAQVQNGTVSIPTRNEEGNLTYQGGSQFNVNNLYPGTNPENAQKASEYFSDGSAPNTGDLESIYDSEEGMDDMGSDAKDSLWEDAHSDTPSISGAAYKVLLDSSDLSRPDFSNDPMLNRTKDTYDNIDLIAEGFGDCTAETTFNDITMSVHNPEYEYCERIEKPDGGCTMKWTPKFGQVSKL